MSIKKGILSSLVAAALLWVAPAHAQYVCDVSYFPASYAPTYGSAGTLSVTYYYGKDCTGGQWGSVVHYCTSGATASNCALKTNVCGFDFLYSELGLQQLASMLQQARLHDEVVVPFVCSSTQGLQVEFN